jgi:hypothetical protein
MRLISVLAWLMMIGGLILGFGMLLSSLFAMYYPALAKYEYSYALLAYFSAAIALLGAGLRTRLGWAWSGTVYLLLYGLFGMYVPAIARTPLPGNLKFLAPGCAIAFLFLWLLFQQDVRNGFEVADTSLLWIRVIAVGYVIFSGVYLVTLLSPKMSPRFGVLKGTTLLVSYSLALTAVRVITGSELYKRNEMARRWAIVFSIVTGIDVLGMTAFDWFVSHNAHKLIPSLVVTLSIEALTIWYLHTRRDSFSRI